NRALRNHSASRALKSRPFIALAAFLTGAIIVGSFAYGSIPGSKGVIHACYSAKTGALRLIDASKQRCVAGKEKGISWHQKGPAGPAGALRCADEQRIKAAAPAFVLSPTCGGASTTSNSSNPTTTLGTTTTTEETTPTSAPFPFPTTTSPD